MVGSTIGSDYSINRLCVMTNSLSGSSLSLSVACGSIAPMRSLLLVAALLAVVPAQLVAADLLAEARRLYNLGQYDAAERAAREAAANVEKMDRGRVVYGRVHTEPFRPTD